VLAAFMAATCVRALTSTDAARPEKTAHTEIRAAPPIEPEQVLGQIRAKCAENAAALQIAEVLKLGDNGVEISRWTMRRDVYAISPGQATPFKEVTFSLDVPCGGGFFWPSYPVKSPEFELETWEFKPRAVKGTTYLITASATINLSNGKTAICRFEPIIVIDGKAISPILELDEAGAKRSVGRGSCTAGSCGSFEEPGRTIVRRLKRGLCQGRR
jgi:hypothetical protein